MKTKDWVETSVLLDNDICPMILASGVSLSIIMCRYLLLKKEIVMWRVFYNF